MNGESRAAIKRSGVPLADASGTRDYTKSTISWALEKCSDVEKERFCIAMTKMGNLDLLFAREFCTRMGVLGSV